MANQSTGGRPSNFRNLSPFTGAKKETNDKSQQLILLGIVAIGIALALIACSLILKPQLGI